MLDHAIGPNVIKRLLAGHGSGDGARTAGRRSRTSAACARDRVVAHSKIRRPDAEEYHGGYDAEGYAAADGRGRPSRRRMTSERRVGRDFVELTEDVSASPLWNPDLAPTPLPRRTWSTYNIAALWIGMSVVITTYTLASGLMQQGMTWWQAMLTILLGNIDRAGADDAQRARRHEVRRVVSRCCAAPASACAAPTCRRCCARSSPAAGSASRPGSAALALDTLLARGVARLGRACPATSGSRSRIFWLIQVAIILSGLEGIKKLESWSAPLLLGGGALLLVWAIDRGGGLGHILARVGAAADGARAVLAAVSRGAHRERRLLGDAQPQHPRLHPLRAQPALAGARPGARPADDDDGVRVHRRRGDQRDDRDLRRGDLGSGRADRADRQRRR